MTFTVGKRVRAHAPKHTVCFTRNQTKLETSDRVVVPALCVIKYHAGIVALTRVRTIGCSAPRKRNRRETRISLYLRARFHIIIIIIIVRFAGSNRRL